MTHPAASHQDGWQDILDDGESIIWQGRPNSELAFNIAKVVRLIFGLFFAGFALFWMIMAANTAGPFWMFGLIHFSVGIIMAGSAILWGPWRRRHTWYTLTTKRAFIATDMPFIGRRLKNYPITRQTILGLRRGELATVIFATKIRRSRNGRERHSIGFERILDGEEVYGMMREIQKNTSEND